MRSVRYIFKISPLSLWREAEAAGAFVGSADDLRDGFIHFSARDQLEGTARKYFAGQQDLLLLAVDADVLGEALRWEPSRGGALFPHLYGAMPLHAVVRDWPLPLDDAGVPILPKDLPT